MSHTICRSLLKQERAYLKKKHGNIRLHVTIFQFGGDPDYEVKLVTKIKGITSEEVIFYGSECCSCKAKARALSEHFDEDINN